MRRVIVAAIVMLALLGVTGCSAPGIVAFDRAQTETDIPDIDYVGWGLDRDSIRFLAEDAGAGYFVARGEGNTLCIVRVASLPEGTASGCGAGSFIGLKTSDSRVELVVSDMGEREGWRRLAPNLYAED